MAERMTEQELQAIKERAEVATPGPWRYDRATAKLTTLYYERLNNLITAATVDGVVRYDFIKHEDGEFIAHAYEDIPMLLMEVERLREALKFYAVEGNFVTFDSVAIKDSGKIARKVLGW